jgi:hypothetical protein
MASLQFGLRPRHGGVDVVTMGQLCCCSTPELNMIVRRVLSLRGRLTPRAVESGREWATSAADRDGHAVAVMPCPCKLIVYSTSLCANNKPCRGGRPCHVERGRRPAIAGVAVAQNGLCWQGWSRRVGARRHVA